MPKVSIISPFYNPTEEQFIKSRRSISNQTSEDFEWITIDDGSNGDVVYEADISLGKNYGPSVARNIGFQISSGEIITYLDIGDDLYWDRVENLIKLYDTYNVQLSFTAYNIINPDGQLQVFNPFNWIGRTMSAIDYAQLLQKQNISTPLGVSHRRKPFVECGGFQRGIVCGEDGVLWRRMIDKVPSNEIVFSDEIAGNYYVLGNSQARTQRRFEMGGFALDGSLKDNGRYLDHQWFNEYTSEGFYESTD